MIQKSALSRTSIPDKLALFFSTSGARLFSYLLVIKEFTLNLPSGKLALFFKISANHPLKSPPAATGATANLGFYFDTCPAFF
jgi:hypothetical protein